MSLLRGLQILRYPRPMVGKYDLCHKWQQLPDGVGKHYPGELPTSADSCQHCRTLSENRTAIAVYQGVAKRDTLSVKLTGQHGAVKSTTPQKASVSDTPKQGIETGFLSAYKARNAIRRYFSHTHRQNRSDSRTAASPVMNIGSGLHPATNGHKNNAVRISYGDQEGDLYANHLLSRSG